MRKFQGARNFFIPVAEAVAGNGKTVEALAIDKTNCNPQISPQFNNAGRPADVILQSP